MGTPFTTTTTTTAPAEGNTTPATDGQLSFIQGLLAERDWQHPQGVDKHVSRAAVINMLLDTVTDDDKIVSLNLALVISSPVLGERLNQALEHLASKGDNENAYLWAPLTRRGASALIEWLKSLRTADKHEVAQRQQADAVDVPAGRYAIDTSIHATNGTAFYKVDRPETGRWAGYVFVKQVIGGDEQKLSMKQGQAIISRIAQVGAEAASARYGHEIGRCGVCDRQLTNDESRARGIGPVCAAKAGW